MLGGRAPHAPHGAVGPRPSLGAFRVRRSGCRGDRRGSREFSLLCGSGFCGCVFCGFASPVASGVVLVAVAVVGVVRGQNGVASVLSASLVWRGLSCSKPVCVVCSTVLPSPTSPPSSRTVRPTPRRCGSGPMASGSCSSPGPARARRATCAVTPGWRCPSRPPTTPSSPSSSGGGSSNGSTGTPGGRSWTSCPRSTPAGPTPATRLPGSP
jgi:hypothetical protein